MLPQAIENSTNNRARQPAIHTRLVHSLQLRPRLIRASAPRLLALLFFIMTGLMAACVPIDDVSPAASWAYSDLRVLSEPGVGEPTGDFIAGYARIAGSDLQLRFDLLDLGIFPDDDYLIALDYQPGGTQELPGGEMAAIRWDYLLHLPAQGTPQVIKPRTPGKTAFGTRGSDGSTAPQNPIPRYIRNPWQDYILVSINHMFIPGYSDGIKIQAFSTKPGETQINDQTQPFDSQGLPPERAPLLLEFWDTFPAFTPAQALRRWDGAHTGPFGERHGLAILLGNIDRYSVPAVMLDLRNPTSLSALDHLGVLPMVKQLQDKKLLTLPDSLPGSPSYPLFPFGLLDNAPQYYLESANQISAQFDFSPSDMLYLPGENRELEPGYFLYFTSESQPSRFPPQVPFPHQYTYEPQTSPEGLSLAIRKVLVTNALEREKNPGAFPILVLGGSLQLSAFGDPGAAVGALSYIANHPWIKPINIDDLRSIPSNANFQHPPGSTTVVDLGGYKPSPILSTLPNPETSEENPLFKEAWTSAFSLYSALPPEPVDLPKLRAAYSGQPGILLAAGYWSNEPYSTQDCDLDLDGDGNPECILADEDQLAVIDPLGARLLAYFIKDVRDVHQIIAPSSQFIIGLGDPSSWLIGAGDGADPAGIHGAFADSPPPWSLYNYSPKQDGIIFSSPEMQIQKEFSLIDSGLVVTYSTMGSASSSIPIAIDPWLRFTPGWSNCIGSSPMENGIRINHLGEMSVDVTSDIPIRAYSFTDSMSTLGVPENPNYDYPPGHYLPFPLILVEFDGQGEFNIQIVHDR